MSSTPYRSGGSTGARPAEGGPSSSSRSQASQAERTADARTAFISSLGVVAEDIDADLQSRATSIHANSASLTKQEKQLQDSTKQLAKENKEMEKWLQKSNKRLAELDDLLNFDDGDGGVEDDLDDLEAMLDALETKSGTGESSDSVVADTSDPRR